MRPKFFQFAAHHYLHVLVGVLCLVLIFGGAFVVVNDLIRQQKPVEHAESGINESQQHVLAGETTGCFTGGWAARKKITFNNSGTTTSLSGFPVLIKLDPNRINYSKTHNNGADIRFEDPSAPGTWLPYEIETWNSGGYSYIWVRVPQIDAGSNSDYIWMYYDNASATDGQQKTAVWDSSYKGVWHLGSIFYDSTSNANNGTNHGATASEGLMGTASNFAGTSTADQYVSIPNSSSINFSNTQNYTLEAWVKLPQDQNYRTYPDNDIISKWTHDTSPPVNPYPYNMRTTNSSSAGGAGEIYSNRYDANGVNPNCSSLPAKFNNNSWVHVAAIKNGTNISMYINGTAVCSATDTTTTTTTNSDPLHFGRRVTARNWLTGSIDEVRISSTNRSIDWVKAEYNAARDAMVSFGTEEQCAASDNSVSIATITPYKTPTPTPTTYIVNTGLNTPIGGYAYPTPTPTVTANFQAAQLNTQQGTATYQIIPTATPSLDRLASLDQTTTKCINSLLTSEEQTKLRYLQPKIPAEEAVLKTLQDKVKICFETYTTVVKMQEASKQISELPPDVKQCVVSAIGLPAYEDIQSGTRPPTTDEKANTQKCFATQEPARITYQTNTEQLNPSIDSCLVLALGNDRYNQIKNNKQQPTLTEKDKVNRCFGVNPNPLSTKPKYTIPPSIDTCLKQGLSESKYLTIKAGLTEPSELERQKANTCFSQLNSLQTQLLSAPPVQVPYLKTDPGTVKINTVTPVTETTTNAKTDSAVVLKGRSVPNSLVQLYVFSDPIVVETQTDQNGDWVYKFNEPLEKGSHLAYATVRAASGEQVRSSVFNFNVAFAAGSTPALGQQYFEENKASAVPSKFFDSSIIMIGGALLLGVIITAITVLKSQQPKAVAPVPSPIPTPTTPAPPPFPLPPATSSQGVPMTEGQLADGQRKSEDSPGPVN